MEGVVAGRAVLHGNHAAIKAPWWNGVEFSFISTVMSDRRNRYLFRILAMVGIPIKQPGKGITIGVMPAVHVVEETL